jgi:hypothetical protein
MPRDTEKDGFETGTDGISEMLRQALDVLRMRQYTHAVAMSITVSPEGTKYY